MFIKEAEFHYFQNFKTGMGIDKLTLDFSERKNPVCIIIGPNGCGKTSLLSYLTPFATMGTLDIRESNKIIIPGKDGYKRIVFVDEEMNEFEIEHFYTYSSTKDTFAIKSYIKMNGVEMNENGNVSSFKELVYEYLDVDMSFLKLIRIGKNVSNLIKAKATERKAFMGKILEDIDWYLKRFKDISTKERDLKVLMAHTIDELKKTEIEDPELAEVSLQEWNGLAEKYKEEIGKKESEKSVLQYQMEELQIESGIKREISVLERQLYKLESSLEEATKENYTSEDLHKQISGIEETISKKMHEKDLLQEDISHTLIGIDSSTSSITSIKRSIQQEEESLNLKSMEEYLTELKKRANNEYRKAFDELPITCTKDEFDEFYVLLKNQQKTLFITYEYGKEPIKEVLKAMKKKEDIPTLIASSLLALESKQNAERLSIIDRLISHYAGIKVSCDKECPLKLLHQEILELKDARPVNEVKFTQEFYQMMRLSYDNISAVFNELSKAKDTIKKLPIDIQTMFTVDHLCDKIGNGEVIYDEKVLNEMLSFLTERENYRNLEKEIEKTEQELENKKKISRVGFLTEELNKEEKKLQSLSDNLDDYRETLASLDEEVNSLHEEQSHFMLMEEALISYEEKRDSLNDLKNRLAKYEELYLQMKSIDESLLQLNNLEREATKNVFTIQTNINTFNHLSENLKIQKATYEDYDNLKFALSNKTGLPLFYIKKYLKKTVRIANEIIDIAYHGSLSLDEFKINEDTFEMPYIKNGVRIDDVSSASQGEESFFNLAISSALRSQSITRFNIGLFDEVDSEFDDNNRQHFIPVLEKTLELNGINQAFLITHNLMFRQYPVDIINLEDLDASTIKVTYE